MADIDIVLEQQVFDIPQRQRELHIRHRHQLDHPGRRVEIAEGAGWLTGSRHQPQLAPLRHSDYWVRLL